MRVRTEFAFREVFGPIEEVAAAVAATGATAGGIVDGSTWGHVRWAKAAKKTGLRPLFGTEAVRPLGESKKKPAAWVLAAETKGFYRFSTALRRLRPDDGAEYDRLFAESPGLVRFAGSGLTDPECFDYIDINPASPLQRARAAALAKRTKRPMVITSDNAYPRWEDVSTFSALVDRAKLTCQFIAPLAKLRAAMPELSAREWNAAVRATHEAAERCVSELPTAPLIQVPGDLRKLVAEGRRYRLERGHIPEWTPAHEQRVERELAMIAEKQYESYFIVVAELILWAKERMLVGPGRGSSAGSLVCYLLRITEVDPLVHDLLFERFIDINRNDLPDIDIDFNDQKRELCFEHLNAKYGAENVARIGNINTLKPKSVMAQVSKRLGIPDHERFDVINVLIEYSSGDSRYGKGLEDTLKNTEPGRRFAEKWPSASIMYRLENHASHTGVHAAGVIVCNDPVSDYCTVGADGVAHIDKPDAETLNLLKIDALGLRTLGVIEDSGVITSEELYGLKLDDPKVFEIFNDRRYSGVFQFEGQAQRRVAASVHIHAFEQIDHVTALARPGPLGGGASQHYIQRAAGKEEVTFRHPSMASYLGPTRGVVLYQEQVMRICFEMGNMPWKVVSEIRKAMSGRKGKEYFDRRGAEFVEGAVRQGIPKADAEVVWSEICTFGAWGMNKSHTVSYGIISYWCAWLKRYHPLEYAAACLRGAKDDEQTIEILREMDREGIRHTPFDIELSDANWAVREGKLLGGFLNLHGVGPAKAAKALAARAAGRLTDEARAKLLALPVKFADLYPLQRKYAGLIADPAAHGCKEGSAITPLDAIEGGQEVLVLVKVLRKELRDENETVRKARRGRELTGPTLFLDIFVTDDTGVPVTLRLDRFVYARQAWAKAAANALAAGDELLARGRSIPGFSMIKADRIKCLNRPEALQ